MTTLIIASVTIYIAANILILTFLQGAYRDDENPISNFTHENEEQ